MRVLVVGSGRHFEDQAGAGASGPGLAGGNADPEEVGREVESFQSAGVELGHQLARRGHVIVVGSEEQSDIDPHVVRGALSLKDGAAKVEVHVPHGFPALYQNEAKVEVVWHQFPDWDVTAMEVIDEVDAVIAIGGRQGVVHAGTAAWMMGKPVIPVGSFGGGAEKVGRYGSSQRAKFYHQGLDDREIDRLTSPWGRGATAEFVVEAMEKVQRARALTRIPVGMLLRVSGLLGVALVLWVAGLVLPFVVGESTWVKSYSFVLLFPTVFAAGMLGSCVQTLRALRGGGQRSGRVVFVDIALGVAAGMIAAVLYLLAQIGVSGAVQVEMAAGDYVRIALIVSLAALFAALYLDKAFARFDHVGESVIEGKYRADRSEDS